MMPGSPHWRYNLYPSVASVPAMKEFKQFAINLAREAGELIVLERDGSDLGREFKDGKEMVTKADLKADWLIRKAITESFTDHLLISEESSPDLGRIEDLQQPLWIVDPIDGTVNYAHGHKHSAVSIAYVENWQVQIGVVFNPFTDELFFAEKGGGAFLNQQAIRVAEETDLSRAIIATGFPYEKSGIADMIKRVDVILHHCADIRRIGSAALDICWLACGRLDGYYESLSVWDFAAARLIALEAGAECGHFSPLPEGADPQFHDRDILMANAALYPKLHALLQPIDS